MTSRVSKYQHVGCSNPWEKGEGVDPAGAGLDYWFRREIVGFRMGWGWSEEGCIILVMFQLRMQ